MNNTHVRSYITTYGLLTYHNTWVPGFTGGAFTGCADRWDGFCTWGRTISGPCPHNTDDRFKIQRAMFGFNSSSAIISEKKARKYTGSID